MPEQIKLAPYIWHRTGCPEPSESGRCNCGYAEAEALAERIDGELKEPATEMASHKWTGCRRGGDPTDAGSVEYVRYCEVCGMEDTCEDPLPACPGTTAEKRGGMTPEVLDEIEERAVGQKQLPDALNRDFMPARRSDVLDLVACVRELLAQREELKASIAHVARQAAEELHERHREIEQLRIEVITLREANVSLLRRLDAALSASRENYAAAVLEREEIRSKLDFILREWKAENDRLRAERDAEGGQ